MKDGRNSSNNPAGKGIAGGVARDDLWGLGDLT